MKKKLFFAALILGIVALNNSCEPIVAVHCTAGGTGFRINLVGFDSTEVSAIETIKYVKGSGFITPIDTFYYKPRYKDSSYEVRVDTWQLGDTLYPNTGLWSGYDYKVIVAPAHREWYVSDIQELDVVQHDRSSSAYDFNCPLGSYVVDSQKIQWSGFLLKR